MKVKIGGYLTYWGPYQIADLLQKVGVSEDKCHQIGKWLSDTWFGDLCQWIHDKRNRTIKIKIDDYDVWSADYTLALIILPILKQYKSRLNGSPFTDDEDVPEELRSTNGETDELFHKRWQWIVEEMIWAFEQIVDDKSEDQFNTKPFDYEACKAFHARIKRGTTLFGKYYRGIWI